MTTLFTKIIQGELPCYKIYEDDRTFAFLDISPEAPGHTLVVPKVEVDKVYDLDDEDYAALMTTVKKLAKHFEKILNQRILIKIIGVDVPHAHVHLIPYIASKNSSQPLKLTDTEMSEIQSKLQFPSE